LDKGRPSLQARRPLRKREPANGISRNGIMVIFFSVILKDLLLQGRYYPFPKPESCPRCEGFRLWGHGFVSAYFDGYDQPFCIKRYRCPDCRCVLRLRPEGYFRRFQASVATIRSSIFCKATTHRWLPGISRSRQCHWFRSLQKRIKVYLSDTWHRGIVFGFDHLVALSRSPISRAI